SAPTAYNGGMRRASSLPLPAPNASGDLKAWATIKSLLPYVWRWRGRVALALVCLVGAKVANVAVPIVFKHIVDGLNMTKEQAFIVIPAALLVAYGALRFATSTFTEL